ncbi:Ctr copper transporter family [Rhizoctonia solani]|uniref:Copper transport protein n=1 Tax=Rhizoctonia solani TaxID=456999 RepID=A0A8H7IM67_9AGAM|nr:Ctr copper transporter family [Rhizoctonia solani]
MYGTGMNIPYLSLVFLVSGVQAMDMSGSSSSSSSGAMAMMIPYLHFTGGDYLFFDAVAPASRGAIAGACIVLAILAVTERAIAGIRGIFTMYVAEGIVSWGTAGERLAVVSGEPPCTGKVIEIDVSTGSTGSQASSEFTICPLPAQRKRSMPPFSWSYELTRGGLFIVQSFFVYAIMLGVMTFNAAYIISIVAGTAVGEILFGRFAAGQTH